MSICFPTTCLPCPVTQVLNGKLMPAITTTTDSSAQLFRRNFLEAGGLQFVINILQKNALPPSTDLSIRQDCYAVVLSLSRCVCVCVRVCACVRARANLLI